MHVIIKKYATTGDGILTAIMMTEEICDSKSSLAKLSEEVKLYPQYCKNVRVKDKESAVSDSRVIAAKEEVDSKINSKGRVLLRESGTEPVVRIMIECENMDDCIAYAEHIAAAMEKGGHLSD